MEPKKKCSNCEELIPESKLILHERFCSQNVLRCKHCNQPIIKDDMEDHIKNMHTKVECIFCKCMFLPTEIVQHQKDCDMQIGKCKFCEINLPKRDLKEHEYVCGSHTEECPICHNYIKK